MGLALRAMLVFYWAIVFALLSGPVFAQQQQLLGVLHWQSATSTLQRSRKEFSVDQFNGCSYVLLTQVAGAVNGHVRWRSVAHAVELTAQGRKISFGWNSSYAHVGETRIHLEHPTVRNNEGFWVPLSFFSGPEFFSAMGSRLEWKPTAVESGGLRVEGNGDKKLDAPPAPVTAVPHTASPSTLHAPRSTPHAPRSTLHAVRRIVLDPGHGGKDPGAVGLHGVEEKALNLAFAQTLAELLREHYSYEVLLTRTDDTFIPLAQRTRIANQWHADMFISLHCNASLSSHLRGFEVYFLSEKASDAHADSVARAENAPLALEDKEAPLPGQLKALLRSLVKNANINDSSLLGSLIDSDVNQRLKTKSLGVQQAAFYVLRGAEMPAVLVETGFLSNTKDERLLQDAEYRRRLLEGVAESIEAYDKRKQKERR